MNEITKKSKRLILQKKEPTNSEDELVPPHKKKFRSCDKTDCKRSPFCLASASPKCARNFYTAKWHHFSGGEHVCTECINFFYRTKQGGYEQYAAWCDKWMESKCSSIHNVKNYISTMIAPFWLRCHTCHKWRQVDETVLDPTAVSLFTCCTFFSQNPEPCSIPEDPRAAEVLGENWLSLLNYTPLLHCPWLVEQLQEYPPDEVGLLPRLELDIELDEEPASLPPPYNSLICPFAPVSNDQPTFPSQLIAGYVIPDQMDNLESQEFTQYLCNPRMFLGLRNLIIGLWNLNPREWLTASMVEKHLHCRGQSRILLVHDLPNVLQFLTHHALINFGLVDPPASLITPLDKTVVVVGAGLAGLATARTLQNRGFNVVVLEARSRLGGRIMDNTTDYGDACVGAGPQILHSALNNPLTTLAYQADSHIVEITEERPHFPRHVSLDDAENIWLHLLLVLDSPESEWDLRKPHPDFPILEKISVFTRLHERESGQDLSPELMQLLHTYMGMLESRQGADLYDISSADVTWPQYVGENYLVTSGFGRIIKCMAQGLNIHMKSPVSKIELSGSLVKVTTDSSTTYHASWVVVAVPPKVLVDINFKPFLPKDKMKALADIGIGLQEKIIFKFDKRFWKEGISGFACPTTLEDRNLFSYVRDLTFYKKEGPFVLEVPIAGQVMEWFYSSTDDVVYKEVISRLTKVFGVAIPEPQGWCITRWKDHPYSKMTSCYIAKETKPVLFDTLAEPLNDQIFFAGDGTHRPMPDTLPAAYLSGIRAAQAICKQHEQNIV